MAFFNSAVGVLQTLVIALGAGLGIWGVVRLSMIPLTSIPLSQSVSFSNKLSNGYLLSREP